MNKYIVILIAMIIDSFIPNITLFSINNLTYFTPLCTLTTLVFFYNETRKYLIFFIISSIIFGVLFIDNLLLAIILFSLVYLVNMSIKKFLFNSYFIILIRLIISIILYDLLFYSLLTLLYGNSFIISTYLYKVSHSLLLNIMFMTTIYFLFYEKGSKHTK